jgi:23S rRNA (guanine745-N1)-methyltransferase
MLSIFGPRNAAETGRILTPEGTLLIAAPGTGHLRELQRPLGMISIDRRKPSGSPGPTATMLDPASPA